MGKFRERWKLLKKSTKRLLWITMTVGVIVIASILCAALIENFVSMIIFSVIAGVGGVVLVVLGIYVYFRYS